MIDNMRDKLDDDLAEVGSSTHDVLFEFSPMGVPVLLPKDTIFSDVSLVDEIKSLEKRVLMKLMRNEFIEYRDMLPVGKRVRINKKQDVDMKTPGYGTRNLPQKADEIVSPQDLVLAFNVFERVYVSMYPARYFCLKRYLDWMLSLYADFTLNGVLRIDREVRPVLTKQHDTPWDLKGEVMYELIRRTKNNMPDEFRGRDRLTGAQVRPSAPRGAGARGSAPRAHRARGTHQPSRRGQGHRGAGRGSAQRTANFCKYNNEPYGCSIEFCQYPHVCNSCGGAGHGLYTCPTVVANFQQFPRGRGTNRRGQGPPRGHGGHGGHPPPPPPPPQDQALTQGLAG